MSIKLALELLSFTIYLLATTMHSYLFTGSDSSKIKNAVDKLAKKLDAKIMEHSLKKIEDVRDLNNLVRLSFNQPTLIVCRSVNEAGEEALNAFLKNLEEPQENIYYALISPSIRILPTIVSRCEIIKTSRGEKKEEENGEIESFLALPVGKKFAFIDKIKDRQRALDFAENTVYFIHSGFKKNKVKYQVEARNIELAVKTYTGLKGNGNVNLLLSNFAIKYENGQQ